MVLDFHVCPQGIQGIHSFCTKPAGFLLDANMAAVAKCRHQARRSACPARALRQSRRCPAILEGESLGGILQERASACDWLPGRCGLLTESSTHGRTGRRPPWCCRSTCEVCFASGDLPIASTQRFSERVEMNSPMPRAWTRVTERIAKPMRSGWLAWAAFVLRAVV